MNNLFAQCVYLPVDEFIRGENEIDDRFTDPCMHLYRVKMRSMIALAGPGCIYIE